MKANSILDVIGGTRLIKLSRLFSERPDVEVWVKLERQNPGGSIKDQDSIDACNRLGMAMVLTGVRHFKH